MIRKLLYVCVSVVIISCNSKTPEETNSMESEPLFKEKHRLQFHFSPEESWMNDPNGLIYFNGEYHLFYQYFPNETVWGPMHWGHAVSKNLLEWEHLPIALYPDSLGYIFSGSTVLDKLNTSGFGSIDNPPLVAIFTYHDPELEKAGSDLFQSQGLAYSLDSGRTWIKYGGNPVLKSPGIRDFRDPKVFWMERQKKWIMSLAVKDRISFYSSIDLKNWNLESEFGLSKGAHGGVWECPDLFEFDGKWILLVSINPGGPNGGSATQYFVGTFDGKNFVSDDDKIRWIDWGRDNYAGVTWSNIPADDGRRLFIGWMSNWDYGTVVPTERWRSAMTIPRVLSFDAEKKLLKSFPVKEVETLHVDSISIGSADDEVVNLNPQNYTLIDLQLNLEAPDLRLSDFAIQLLNAKGDTLTIDYAKSMWQINRDKAGENNFSEKFKGLQTMALELSGTTASMRLLIDLTSLELFVNEGEGVMTSLFFPEEPFSQIRFLNGKNPLSLSGRIYKLKPIWQR